ncbi:hypothetical protein ABNB56_07125 [Streptococcus iniae]|nr:hypothetical protein [Streptococcus iniae]
MVKNLVGLDLSNLADGKRWISDAVFNIAAYLKSELAEKQNITVLY